MNSIVEEIFQRHISKKSEFVFSRFNQKTKEQHCPLKNSDKWFRAACRRVGIKDLRFNDLRCIFGTRMAMLVNLVLLQKLMRHTDPGLTQKYYVKLNQQTLKDEVEKLAWFHKNGRNGQN
jgi:integrase